MQSSLSVSAPLSPVQAENARGRIRYHQRIPWRFGRKLSLVVFAILGLLACPSQRSLVAADQGGYYNDYGGYDYNNGNNNEYEEEQFDWPDDVGFDEVSVLPVSCVN